MRNSVANNKEQHKILSLLNRFYLYFFLSKFSVYFPFFAFYLVGQKGFTGNQILTLFAIHAISKFIFEIPTGIFADRFGEKLSVVLSSFFLFISTVFLITGDYYFVIIAEVLFGLGETFSSGSSSALAYHFFEENKTEFGNKNISYEKFSSHYIALMWLSIGLSAIAGQFLAHINITLPFYATAAVFLLLIFTTLRLPNIQVEKQSNISNIFLASSKEIVKNSKLRMWLLLSIFFSTAIVIGYQLVQPLLNETKLAGPQNGFLYFIITLFAFLGSKLQPKINNILKSQLLFVVMLCLSLSALLYMFGTIVHFWQLIIIACIYRIVWGLASPLFTQELNFALKNNSVRSSVLSISSMIGGLTTAVVLRIFVLLNKDISFNYSFLAIFMAILTTGILIQIIWNIILKRKHIEY